VRVLIVDDEPLARRGVVHRLRRFKDVEIVGECGDGVSAVERILERSPDVVFLDIQMPGMDGFEVLRALPRESMPAVIFLTAYEQHVLRAFDVHALHYLLKPVDDSRFAAAVGRARDLVDSSLKAEMAQRVMKLLDRASDNTRPDLRCKLVPAFKSSLRRMLSGLGLLVTMLNCTSTVVLSWYARRWLLSNRSSTRRSFFAYTAPELCSPKAYWNCDPSRTANLW
jgi:DNA-binding NarL/FixJ family response regulator